MQLTEHEKIRLPWLMEADVISADNFPFYEHCLDNSFLYDTDGESIILPKGWMVIGYCDGNTLRVRPRPGIAVKFADESGEFWMHVASRCFLD
jgi:hypothetical protein